ncbi:MAG: FAD-binding oxidoreductase, partial [Pseudomonadota bacterium]
MMAFYPLEVLEVRAETRDAVAVTLAPPAEAEEAFSFRHGQYLTFRRDFDGEELRRSYSICAAPGEALRVGIKRVQGGAFSSWAHGELQPGDMIEAMPPAGRFTHDLVPDAGRHYLGFAIGSGITPVLSIVKTVLRGEPLSRFTLVYGNRSATSIMFREELEDLKNRYLGRLNLIHILKNDAQEVDLFTGRIDAEKCERLFAGLVDVKGADLAFICGPEGMMKTVSAALQAHGMAEDRIRYELFGAAQPGRARVAAVDAATIEAGASARITMDGATRE